MGKDIILDNVLRMMYDKFMQRISVHIPDETRKMINLVVKAKSKNESEIIREALDKGLNIIYPKSNSAQALLDFAKMAEKIPTRGKVPKDASINHDYYLWGGEKRE